MKKRDKCWLAGVIDKGSYVGVASYNNSTFLQFKFQTTNFKLVQRILDICKCGHYLTRPGKRLNTYYIVYFSPLEAERILREVRPYVRTKGQQIDIGLQYRKIVTSELSRKQKRQRYVKIRLKLAKIASRGPKSTLVK